MTSPSDDVDPRVFGDPVRWPAQDLIGVSDLASPEVIVAAYRAGLFPMPDGQQLGWFSPLQRAVLPLDGLRITRSLRRSRKRYRVAVDTDFAGVIAGCGDPTRPYGWIDDYIGWAYGRLFAAGTVHTVETYDAEGRLVGGLYGVGIGGLFAGESMFHDPVNGRDASKVALAALVDLLAADGEPRLLDVQWATPHLSSLGVVEVPRTEYLERLTAALMLPEPRWPGRATAT